MVDIGPLRLSREFRLVFVARLISIFGFGAPAAKTLLPNEPWLWAIYAIAVFNGFFGSFSAGPSKRPHSASCATGPARRTGYWRRHTTDLDHHEEEDD